MKKIWSILLCVAILMGVTLCASAATQGAPMAVEAQRSADNSELTVDIVLKEAVSDGTFALSYQKKDLRLVSVSAPDPDAAEINGPADVSGVSAGADLEEGSVEIAFVFDECGQAGDVLLQCRFQVVGTALSTTVNVLQADLNNEETAVACPDFSKVLRLKELNIQETPSDEKEENPSKSFTDVTSQDWFCKEVMEMAGLGYIQGVSETEFAPNSGLTRAMLVTILYRIDGEKAAANGGAFQDVAKGSWYEKAVNWASANGIVTGYSESVFAPDDPITRQQMAAVLWRYAKYKGIDVGANGTVMPEFEDLALVQSWATEAISWAYSRGIMKGQSATRLAPEGGATRAEAAVMLYRMMQLLPQAQ